MYYKHDKWWPESSRIENIYTQTKPIDFLKKNID